MTELFIPYTQALALKELGFDEPCFQWQVSEKHESTNDLIFLQYKDDNSFVYLPLYQQSFKWFREKYGLNFYIFQCYHKGVVMDYHPVIHLKGQEEPINDTLLNEHPTYEEAELACIIKLIEIVKTLKIED